MTVTPATEGSNLPVVPEDLETGLEDFSLSEGVIPRIKIDHNEGEWSVNIFQDQTFPKLTAVMLGLVKQRILWDTEVEEDSRPLCKSVDAITGNPDPQNFPWRESTFDPNQFTFYVVSQEDDKQRQTTDLPCAACRLKEWGTFPKGNNPWCALQHTYPMLLDMASLQSGEAFNAEDAQWMPALVSVAKTGIRPSSAYLTPFATSKQPLYTVYTELSLREQKKGSRPYSVPVFRTLGKTQQADYPMYHEQYRQMRSFLVRPPTRTITEVETAPGSEQPVSTQPEAAPGQPTAPAPTAPAPAPTSTPPSPPAPAVPAVPAPAATPATSTQAPARATTTAAVPDDLPF